jgi:hypothetical protein
MVQEPEKSQHDREAGGLHEKRSTDYARSDVLRQNANADRHEAEEGRIGDAYQRENPAIRHISKRGRQTA